MSENTTDRSGSEVRLDTSSSMMESGQSRSPSDPPTSQALDTQNIDELVQVKQEPIDFDDTEQVVNSVYDDPMEETVSRGSSPALLDHTSMDGCSPPVTTKTPSESSGENSNIRIHPSLAEQEEEMRAMRRDLDKDRGAAYQNKEFRLSDYRKPEMTKSSDELPASTNASHNTELLHSGEVQIKKEPSDTSNLDSCTKALHQKPPSRPLSTPVSQRPTPSILADTLSRPGSSVWGWNSFTGSKSAQTAVRQQQPSSTMSTTARSLTVPTTNMKPVAVLVPVSIPVTGTRPTPGSVIHVKLPTSTLQTVVANGNSSNIPVVTLTNSANAPVVSATSSTVRPKSLTDKLQQIHENAVAELLTESNVIPRYTASSVPAKFRDSFPSVGFTCKVCGDKFLFRTSLETHLKRMSMQIKYRCDICLKSMGSLVFTNKCAFLTHVKSHGGNFKTVKSCNVTISPLSAEMMDNIVDMVVTESDYEDASSAWGSISGSIIKKTSWKCVECSTVLDSSHSLAKHFGSETSSYVIKCPHCDMHLPEPCALMAHQRIHKQSKPYVCPECGLVIQGNADIFQKHLEKCCHFSRTLGYKCPRCPIAKGNYADITIHMLYHKETYYKCQHCPMAFKTENTIKSHLESAHSTEAQSFSNIYKCSLCDTVFHSLQQLTTHTQQHVRGWMENAKFFFKCLHCNKLFEDKAYLSAHMSVEHQLDLHFLMCEICGNKYKTLLQLNDHLLTHADLVMPLVEKIPSSAVKDKVVKQKSLLICEYCGDNTFLDEVQLGEHVDYFHQSSPNQKKLPKMKKGRGPSLFRCSACKFKSPLKSTDIIISHIEKHREEGIFICSCCITAKFESLVDLNSHEFLCRKKGQTAGQKRKVISNSEKRLEHPCSKCRKSFALQEQLVKHLKSQHGIITQFPCHLCGLTYDTRHSLQHHIRIVHEGKKHMYLCWICQSKNIKRTFTKRFKLEKHLITKHRIPKNIIDPDKFPRLVPGVNDKDMIIPGSPKRQQEQDGSEVPIRRLKVAGDTTFNCAKCSFFTDDGENFRHHITEHKSENDSQQCPECGLCFAVLPSLKKHLRMVHKIKDVVGYLLEKGIEEPEEPEDVNVDVTTYIPSSTKLYTPKVAPDSKVENGNPLECTVCYKDFASEAILKSHMRTHGMAFIRSKRSIAAGGADTSPK